MEVRNFPSIWVVAVVQAGVWVWCVRTLLLPVWDMEAKAPVLYMILLTPAWFMLTMIIIVPTILSIFPLFATPLTPTNLGEIARLAVSAALVGLYIYGFSCFRRDFLGQEDCLGVRVSGRFFCDQGGTRSPSKDFLCAGEPGLVYSVLPFPI